MLPIHDSADHKEFFQLFKDHNLTLPDWIDLYSTERLIAYYNFLVSFNEPGGFFSKNDSEKIFSRHFYESLIFTYYVSRTLSVSRETKLADAGTGPGLPGYLFACLNDPPYVSLIDSSKRRLSFLEKELRHSNRVTFSYDRIENSKNKFDIITARALIPFPVIAEVLTANIQIGGYAALFSADKNEPDHKAASYLKKLGFVSREILVPGEINIETTRTIKILQKIAKAESGYPRQWKKIKDDIALWQK